MNETCPPPARGPNGGNLDGTIAPEHRRAPFQPIKLADSTMPGLHRFDATNETGYTDVARHGLKNEQAWHRMAAFMILAGRTNSEIAMAANRGVDEVSILRSQRWFQELLSTLANDKGEELTGIIDGYSVEAAEEIYDLMKSSDSDRIKLTAAQILLEQSRGKPKQFIQSETRSGKLDPKTELEEIDRDLAAIKARQAR